MITGKLPQVEIKVNNLGNPDHIQLPDPNFLNLQTSIYY